MYVAETVLQISRQRDPFEIVQIVQDIVHLFGKVYPLGRMVGTDEVEIRKGVIAECVCGAGCGTSSLFSGHFFAESGHLLVEVITVFEHFHTGCIIDAVAIEGDAQIPG